jgi:UDP-GlcNAc:undecaprenyl-phosphate GlcNAc-1-phosphate transferase
MGYVIYALPAGLTAFLVTYLVMPYMARWGKLPDFRISGLAVYLGISAALASTMTFSDSLKGLMLGGGLLVFLGFSDRRWRLRPVLFWCGVGSAALVSVYFGYDWHTISLWGGRTLRLGEWGYLAGSVWIIVVCYTFKRIQLSMGSVAGMLLTANLLLAAVTFFFGEWSALTLTLALLGASLALIRYSRTHVGSAAESSATIYLGYLLAAALTLTFFHNPYAAKLPSAIWFVGLLVLAFLLGGILWRSHRRRNPI